MPRILVGESIVAVPGTALAELARGVRGAAPALAGPVLDPATPLTAASSVLLVSSAAGG